MKKEILSMIVIFLLLIAVEWGIVCGIIKLICLCFDLTFSWKISTGIWLILIIVHQYLRSNNGGK